MKLNLNHFDLWKMKNSLQLGQVKNQMEYGFHFCILIIIFMDR